MSKKRTVRRLRDGEIPVSGPIDDDLKQAAARADAAQASPEKAARQPIDMGELEALANMDMSDLDALMAGSYGAAAAKVGDRVQGVLTRRGKERSLVDVGAKSEAVIETLEIGEAQVGDAIDAYVVSNHEGELLLSTAASGEAADKILEDAKENETPMRGTVTGRNPGGFDVRLGGVRAFCPVSQIDRSPAADLDTYIGQDFDFLVLETGKDVVVSRRKVQDKQRAEGWDAFWEQVNVGDTFEGVVTNVQPFGVFVDIGSAEGLVHRSELGWGNSDPSSLSRGDRLTVRILELNEESGKIGLSAKDPANSPWKRAIGSAFQQGGTYQGVVKGVEQYGAFVELAPGLEGLLHTSRAGGALPKPGESVQVRLDKIDHERQRLELSNPDHAASSSSVSSAGEEVEGTVEDVLRNGVVVALADGRTGWLPERNADLPAGTVVQQRFRRGRPITARIVEERPDGRRVTLTQKSDAGGGDWRGKSLSSGGGGFGTLGDLLGNWNKGGK